MPAPIIAAYEPYGDDRAPVSLALAMAELSDAPVIAATVYPWPASDPPANGYAFVSEAMQWLEDDLGVETRIVHDTSAPRGLHELARDERAGLIVVGSTNRGRAGRVIVGSTALRVLQGAPCPVAVAPWSYRPQPLKTIAVGFVDSPEGRAALATAHALAALAGARLHVIAALPLPRGLDGALPDRQPPLRSWVLDVERAIARALRELPNGVDVERELRIEDPADVLLRVSERVDLLVCGARGYGPLRSVLLGGVTRRLVDGACCPVLVLPRGARVPLEDLTGVEVMP